MTENPYESPVVLETEMLEAELCPRKLWAASRMTRFLNLIVDTIVIQAVVTVLSFVIGMAYATVILSIRGTITEEDNQAFSILGFFVGMATHVGYYLIMETVFQKTLAKFLTGTCVVTANGGRPSFGQIVGRSFARLILFEAFSFLIGERPIGWHDSLSGTRVISTR